MTAVRLLLAFVASVGISITMLAPLFLVVFWFTSAPAAIPDALAAAMPEVVVRQDNSVLILGIVGAVATVMTAGISAIVAIYVAKLNSKATVTATNIEVAAVKVEEVKETLQASGAETAGKLEHLQKVADDTHVLVNSNMGVQLKLGADLSDFKAATTKAPSDIQAALLARRLYDEHVEKQAVVNSKTKS